MRTLVCIVGPTASGKSAVADEVAVRLSSSVISVDAMQVYRGMDIGTAKTPPDQRRCELLMVDVVDIGQDYSVELFKRQARTYVDELISRDVNPVLCGGTGLYLNAVIDEMDFPSGETRGEARRAYEELAEKSGSKALWDLLEQRDPASAGLIHPNNVRRVVRALEMLDGGVSYAANHEGLYARKPRYPYLIFGLNMDRARLYSRIDLRVDRMFEDGLVREVEDLVDDGMACALTSKQAIGYKEVIDAIEGRCTLDEARAKIKQRSRHYAKRQLTFFRKDERICWLDMDDLDAEAAADIIVRDVRAADERLCASKATTTSCDDPSRQEA